MFSRCRDRRRGLGQGCTCCPAGCAPGRDGKWLPQPCAVPGNVRRTGLNQITGLLCLQASCVSLKGRRKFFALNRAGNRELCVSCTCNYFFFNFVQAAHAAACSRSALQRPLPACGGRGGRLEEMCAVGSPPGLLELLLSCSRSCRRWSVQPPRAKGTAGVQLWDPPGGLGGA